MTDPLFTPLYPLSLDAAGILEGTHITTKTTARRTEAYRCAVSLDQLWRISAWDRMMVFLASPSAVTADDPVELRIAATLLWFKGNTDSIVFAHPYDDVKRLWGEYLLRQGSKA
jgi:hypothetical protein